MNSQYSIVDTILNQINSQASTSQNDDLRSIIRNIANKYGRFACGSRRAVIVLPDDDFAGQSNYIIVCPYYQPIIERYDELVDNIVDGIDVTVSDIMEIYTDKYIDMHFEGVDNVTYKTLIGA